MRRLTSIVAMNHDGAIGIGNRLPWRLRTDMALFRAATIGHVVMLGHKTFESLGGRPLSGRTNIVLSHDGARLGLTPETRFVQSVGEALSVATAAGGPDGDGYVIGGGSIYGQFADLVDRYLVTMVDKAIPDADTFFDIGLLDGQQWRMVQHAHVAADPETDDADFAVFELLHEHPEELATRRAALVETYRAAAESDREDAPAPSLL